MNDYPEIKLAKRLVERYKLRPPVDVETLARDYAEVEFDNIPFDVDGVCLDLKVSGKKPHIIVNTAATDTRRRFTLAHELGHAYHNLNLADRTMLQSFTPMTLAETASIFCQTIILDAALKDSDPEDQFVLLEGSLQDACQVVVDISSRFIFEQAVFQKRKERELSVGEFNELMLDAQRETYGDGLDLDLLHPYMWAVKSHYYNPGLSYYNFPYMFGLLFALGLYARYLDDPEQFKIDYDELLSSTGLGDAADLASRFGIDLRQMDFWRGSLDVIRRDIDRFEELVEKRVQEQMEG